MQPFGIFDIGIEILKLWLVGQNGKNGWVYRKYEIWPDG
jgi:hypothetical protein